MKTRQLPNTPSISSPFAGFLCRYRSSSMLLRSSGASFSISGTAPKIDWLPITINSCSPVSPAAGRIRCSNSSRSMMTRELSRTDRPPFGLRQHANKRRGMPKRRCTVRLLEKNCDACLVPLLHQTRPGLEVPPRAVFPPRRAAPSSAPVRSGEFHQAGIRAKLVRDCPVVGKA
jgi:hypothetical protein